MSGSSAMNNDRPSTLTTNSVTSSVAATLADKYHANPMTTPLEVLGFWTAIALPFCYLPLLAYGAGATALVLVVLVNVLALLLGHTHRRD